VGGGLHLRLSEEGADAERLAELTRHLRGELLQLDVEQVSVPSLEELPAGAKAAGAAAAGALLVALSQSANSLQSVLSGIWHWLHRAPANSRTVRIELDGDVLELSQAPDSDAERLIQLFVSRHSITELEWPGSGKP
jgi:hypothetical protein